MWRTARGGGLVGQAEEAPGLLGEALDAFLEAEVPGGAASVVAAGTVGTASAAAAVDVGTHTHYTAHMAGFVAVGCRSAAAAAAGRLH